MYVVSLCNSGNFVSCNNMKSGNIFNKLKDLRKSLVKILKVPPDFSLPMIKCKRKEVNEK